MTYIHKNAKNANIQRPTAQFFRVYLRSDSMSLGNLIMTYNNESPLRVTYIIIVRF